MKKTIMLLSTLMFLFLSVNVFAVEKDAAQQSFKAGDTIYVCQCGKACKCGTMSHKTGKCGCGMALVKATVTKSEDGKVYYNIDGKEFSAPATGKYVCPCGAGCNCNTVSQKPGKCACGKELKKVE
jgi:hypothetical protein